MDLPSVCSSSMQNCSSIIYKLGTYFLQHGQFSIYSCLLRIMFCGVIDVWEIIGHIITMVFKGTVILYGCHLLVMLHCYSICSTQSVDNFFSFSFLQILKKQKMATRGYMWAVFSSSNMWNSWADSVAIHCSDIGKCCVNQVLANNFTILLISCSV